MMNILLTGANGFIGRYFINKYAHKYHVHKFSFLNDDFNNLNCNSVDVVVHLSALVHQMDGASAEEYEKVNVIQTIELAKKAKNSGVKHFIFMSTVKVYGEENDLPDTETSPCHPQDDYGKSKLQAEQELQKLEDESFIVSIIRTPIVYGAGVKANIKNLINLVQKLPILPFGNTHNIRSIVYVGNLCALMQTILEQKRGGTFLAADDESLSTTEFIHLIADALNKKIYLIQIPLFGALLKRFKPSFHQRLFQSLSVDNTKTKQHLHFQNPYSVKEGIHIMIQGTAL